MGGPAYVQRDGRQRVSTVERQKSCEIDVDDLDREKKTVWQKMKHVLTRNVEGTNPDRRYYTHAI